MSSRQIQNLIFVSCEKDSDKKCVASTILFSHPFATQHPSPPPQPRKYSLTKRQDKKLHFPWSVLYLRFFVVVRVLAVLFCFFFLSCLIWLRGRTLPGLSAALAGAFPGCRRCYWHIYAHVGPRQAICCFTISAGT